MTTATEQLYDKITAGDPKAVAYYENLKKRIADGRRAENIRTCIRAIHERRKTMNVKTRVPFTGAESYPAGSYITPNGKVLTPTVLTKLVGLFRDAAYGVATTAPNPTSSLPAATLNPAIKATVNPAVLAAIQPKPSNVKVLGKKPGYTSSAPSGPKTAAQLKAQYENAVKSGRPPAILNALKTQWQNAALSESIH